MADLSKEERDELARQKAHQASAKAHRDTEEARRAALKKAQDEAQTKHVGKGVFSA